MPEMNRFALKFCFRAGLSATETLIFVQKAYENDAVDGSNILGGILCFDMEGPW